MYQGRIPLYAYGELNRKDWAWADVPGVWEKAAEKYSLYEGIGWYYRSFEAGTVTKDTVARLRFSGVIYRADIYLNGEYVGFHESGYVEFTKDVTGILRSGINHLAVMVDNRPLIVKWPHDWGYMNYGGIHGSVMLEMTDGAYLDDFSLTPDWDCGSQKGLLRVKGNLKRSSCGTVTVETAGRCYTVSVPDDGSFDETLVIEDVKTWSPSEPVLYDTAVRIGGETWCTKKIGFCHIAASDCRILLNGKPFRLNGCCYLYDSPRYGLTAVREQIEADLKEMKAAGVNAIRTHYPMDEIFYSLCDEMGFVSWIELPVYCTKPPVEKTGTIFSDRDYVDNAVMILEEMIAVARSHASVVIYSIGNECNVEHPEAMPFFTVMAATVRNSDPSRLVAYAALYGLVGQIGELLDVIGINCYDGWYNRISKDYRYEPKKASDGMVPVEKIDLDSYHRLMDEIRSKLPEGMPAVLSEFGGDSVPGYCSSAEDLWSEDYHAALVREMILASRKHSFINGTFVFAFIDYLDPSKPRNGYWNEYNLKGMLTYERDRKLPFYALQDVYCGKDALPAE